MTARRVSIAFLLLAALSTWTPAAEEGTTPGLAALFDTTAARRPRAGEWLEYIVSFPADPLENSLGNSPLPGIDGVNPATVDPLLPLPAFEPPEAWRSLSLRLEILGVDAAALRARIRFADQAREVTMPLASGDPTALFHYPEPQSPAERAAHRIDGYSYEVTVERRRGDHYGFARMVSPDLPFGLARFATRDVDVILVGMGSGQPPIFPMPARETVSPPPGLFYREDG